MIKEQTRTLLLAGMILFLLGLLNGAVIPLFFNTRMGLSAHLAAVQNGLVLLAFGFIWQHIELSPQARRLCLTLSIYSMYAIWVGIVLAAILGTSQLMPIAGAGFSASAENEMLVNLFEYSGATASIIAAIQIIVGLYRRQS